MSWDIVLFNSSQRIASIEDLDDSFLEPTDFCSVLNSHFPQVVINDDHQRVEGAGFSIEYYADAEKTGNKMVSLNGEHGLFELVVLARMHNWQIFDTGSGEMIDLDHPEQNGYDNFQTYLERVLSQ